MKREFPSFKQMAKFHTYVEIRWKILSTTKTLETRHVSLLTLMFNEMARRNRTARYLRLIGKGEISIFETNGRIFSTPLESFEFL